MLCAVSAPQGVLVGLQVLLEGLRRVVVPADSPLRVLLLNIASAAGDWLAVDRYCFSMYPVIPAACGPVSASRVIAVRYWSVCCCIWVMTPGALVLVEASACHAAAESWEVNEVSAFAVPAGREALVAISPESPVGPLP